MVGHRLMSQVAVLAVADSGRRRRRTDAEKLPRLSRMTTSPGVSVGARTCSTQAVKASPVIGPLKTQGASIRSARRAAMKVNLRQWPCGARPGRRLPRGPQPLTGAMLVFTQVSSMKTSLPGSIRPWCRRHRTRLAAICGRSVSLVSTHFFEAEALGVHETNHPFPQIIRVRFHHPCWTSSRSTW